MSNLENLYDDLKLRFDLIVQSGNRQALLDLRDLLIEETKDDLWPHWFFLGRCYARLGDFAKAQECRKATERLLHKID
jgi:hypothetical protein